MGVSYSCPFSVTCDVEDSLESMIVSLGDEQLKTTMMQSLSFKTQTMVKEGSLSFKGLQNLQITISNYMPKPESLNLDSEVHDLSRSSPKHEEAAVKLQKVYKSFRTRRKLADCAVLVEQSWWKLLDFAQLKRSSVSFFDIDKHETAISRWSRARTRAAKVGKGLSKNAKAQKLALQHWLEAIDPRHRYGHNLQFYYVEWLQSQSREPFFYWLDIGEGKEVNLVEKCPRSKLQKQWIKYLGPMERKAYEVVINDGKFFNKQTQELLHTSGEEDDVKWIFVLSTSKDLYVGIKKKGKFQHSSFLAGGATVAAGRLVVQNGILKAVWPHSGHYCPTEENFRDFVSFLKENNVDLDDVKMSPVAEDEDHLNKQQSRNHMRSHSSEDDFIETLISLATGEINPEDVNEVKSDTTEQEQVINASLEETKSRGSHNLFLEIPATSILLEGLESKPMLAADGYESTEEEEGIVVKDVPKESILQRINSHKGMGSYQLGKQLSCKWTTGAGPRIGCVRDYPSELQVHALEQVNLSPRSACPSRPFCTPRVLSGCFSGKLETAISLPVLKTSNLLLGSSDSFST
ncbi:hypothetical protein ACFE04_014973 [Oxalis oulophora]